MPVNKQIVLDSRPTAKVSAANFRLVEKELPTTYDGYILVRNHYLSLDPYMRGRLNDVKSYARPQQVDEVMGGGTVGEVIESHRAEFSVGDFVVGPGGWQQFSMSDGMGWRKVSPEIPLSAYLGVVGMPGVTAWYGLNEIIKPKAGDFVVGPGGWQQFSASDGAGWTVVDAKLIPMQA